jgi:homoserine kinase
VRPKSVQVKIPASTANLGPGFDTIGMAFQLYTTIRMEIGNSTIIRLHGNQLTGLPTNKTNLVYRVVEKFFSELGEPVPELIIDMDSEVPLTRGLGSSAAAIVGALVAANELAGGIYSKEELLNKATEWEGHPDNVGASLYGGIIVACMENNKVRFVQLNVPEQLEAIAVIPHFMLKTEKARNVLPESYSRKDVVYNTSHAGVLIAALATGKLDVLVEAMKDVVHHPYRAPLVPGLEEIINHAHEYGSLGTALSGAGPTILALIDKNKPTDLLESYMVGTLKKYGIDSTLLRLKPDQTGVVVEKSISGVAQ